MQYIDNLTCPGYWKSQGKVREFHVVGKVATLSMGTANFGGSAPPPFPPKKLLGR